MLRIIQQVGASRRQLSRLIPVRFGAVPAAVLPLLIAIPWSRLDAYRNDRPFIVSAPLLGIYLALALLAIARALINHPDIILADEPTGNLDRTSAQEIMDLLLDLNRAGHIIILVTHDEGFANLCPRKITISDGQIVSDRRKDEA